VIMSASPRQIGAAAAAAAPTDSEELKRALAAVDAAEFPLSMSAGLVEEMKKERKAQLRAQARQAGGAAAALAAPPGAGEDAAGQAAEGARYLPLKKQLEKEVGEHAKLIKQCFWEGMKEGFKSIYGDPLEEGTALRYRFWPERMAAQPLLYYCAERLLGTGAASTCFVERRHSSAGYIMSKLRARLKPSTAENLTLAYYMLREQAKAEAAGIEVMDLLAELSDSESE